MSSTRKSMRLSLRVSSGGRPLIAAGRSHRTPRVVGPEGVVVVLSPPPPLRRDPYRVNTGARAHGVDPGSLTVPPVALPHRVHVLTPGDTRRDRTDTPS